MRKTMTYHDRSSILILGRALHAPWNEGTRVIARDISRAAGQLRPAHTLSLTHEAFRDQASDSPAVEHIYTCMPYGARSDYAALGALMQAARPLFDGYNVGVAHLVGLPLALAPWLHQRAPVVAHVTLAEHAYQRPIELLRATLGWRCFDRWVDAYACSSEHVREQLAARGYPSDRLHVVPPPVDIERFRPVERAAARRALDLPEDGFVVAYLGTLSPLRFPVEMLLRALALAAPGIPGLRLAVFAPVSTHPYNVVWAEQHLCRASASSAVPVALQLRDLREDEKHMLYSAADVVLLPFAAPVAVEPPLTLLEAMACGATVAVAPAANRSAVVADGVNGATFDTPELLGARLGELFDLGALYRAALGAAARATIEARFGFAAVARALEAVWDSVETTSASRKHTICHESVSS
jgi:glycosyltransferase involved in cell wall biosynthesis